MKAPTSLLFVALSLCCSSHGGDSARPDPLSNPGSGTDPAGVVSIRGVAPLAVASEPGLLDPTFAADLAMDGPVYAIALQTDGKILLGGSFRHVNGLDRTGIARLDPDGALDEQFTPPDFVFDSPNPIQWLDKASGVHVLLVQPDGDILVIGTFTATVSGVMLQKIARLHADGSPDLTCRSDAMTGGRTLSVTFLADAEPLLDGNFVVGGSLKIGTALINAPCGVARLTPYLKLDTAFRSPMVAQDSVYGLVADPEGFLVAGGAFLMEPKVGRRLRANGSQETVPSPLSGGSARAVARQVDGKLLIAGLYSIEAGGASAGIVRVHPNLELDPSFDAGPAPDNSVQALAIQRDGSVIAGGDFTMFAGNAVGHIVRLNPDGSTDPRFHASPGADTRVHAVSIQSDGRILVGGDFTTYHALPRSHLVRLTTDAPSVPKLLAVQVPPFAPAGSTVALGVRAGGSPPPRIEWRRNGVPVPGATNPVLTIENVLPAVGGEYSVRVSNESGDEVSGSWPLQVGQPATHPGALDLAFVPEMGAMFLKSVVPTPDGKLLVGGDRLWSGMTLQEPVLRLNADGSLDPTFAAQINDGSSTTFPVVQALALDTPGRPLAAVWRRTTAAPPMVCQIQRFLADGGPDPTFAGPVITGGVGSATTTVVPHVGTMLVQSDGTLVVAGEFTAVNGIARSRLARLEPDGALDTRFDPGIGPDAVVCGVLAQTRGRLVVVGEFARWGEAACAGMAAVDAAGAIDPTFTCAPGAQTAGGLPAAVRTVASDSDGRIIVAGDFAMFHGASRQSIARLDKDGGLDLTFDPGAGASGGYVSNRIHAVAVQADGRVLIGGTFTAVNGVSRNRIARLHTDGRLDETFDPGLGVADGEISLTSGGDATRVTLVRQISPESVLLIGSFNTVDGQRRGGLARLFTQEVDPPDAPVLRGVHLSAAGFEVTVHTWPGYVYHLERSEGLSGGVWTTRDSVPGNGIGVRLTDPDPPAGRGFYRLRVDRGAPR